MNQRMSDRIWSWLRLQEGGQDLLEYALIVALIVVVVMTAVSPVGLTIKTVFWDAIATTYSAI
jgi:Flp pilus assembly pilin Flp